MPSAAFAGAVEIGLRTAWPGLLVWLSNMGSNPVREALGLTSHTLDCDRLEVCYRVLTPGRCTWWPLWARELPRAVREQVEGSRGARPAHWWVAEGPVMVALWGVREGVEL